MDVYRFLASDNRFLSSIDFKGLSIDVYICLRISMDFLRISIDLTATVKTHPWRGVDDRGT